MLLFPVPCSMGVYSDKKSLSQLIKPKGRPQNSYKILIFNIQPPTKKSDYLPCSLFRQQIFTGELQQDYS